MQLITILLVVVSVLIILSGISILAGSNKKERIPAIWFLLSAIGATVWAVSVGMFLSLSEASTSANNWVKIIFIGSILMMIALCGYVSWSKKLGKILTSLFALFGAGLIALVLVNPNFFFEATNLSRTGNTVTFAKTIYLWLYGGLISSSTFVTVIFLILKILKTRKKSLRNGYIVFLIGLSINSMFSLIFDLILPMSGNCSLMWLGPLAIGITMLAFYYAILRYRLLSLSSSWMRILSYVILMTSGAVLYMVIFYIVFSALFRNATPSPEVILLNFVMVLILLLSMPAINEISAFARSLSSVHDVDIAYVIKKLNTLTSKKVNLKELADFLSEHMHFSFIGFLIDGRIYGSGEVSLSAENIVKINKLKPAKTGIWQDFSEPVLKIATEQGITAVAELKDANGKVFGQIIVGKSLGKQQFDRKDLVQLEMIINLVAAIVESGKHALKKKV